MLWAVRVRAQDESMDLTYPTGSQEEAVESVDRLNSWVGEFTFRHPDIPMDLAAEVVTWPHGAAEHQRQLKEHRAAEEEWSRTHDE